MALRIPSYDRLAGSYAVRYAETHESIFKTVGWKKSLHRYWALDVGPVRGSVRVKGEVFRRDRNSVALYAPGVRYDENIEVGSLVSWAWLLIEEQAEPSLLARLTGKKGYCFLTDPTQSVRKQIQYFVESSHLPDLSRGFFLTANLHQILGTLFSLENDSNPSSKVKGRASHLWVHPWRKAAWELLEATEAGTIKSAELAERLGVSLSTLTHRYREHCGESLHDTINGWRLEKACTLLTESDLSIKEIAVRTGLAHQSYLSNFLKKEKGLTPSEYRKISKREPDAEIHK